MRDDNDLDDAFSDGYRLPWSVRIAEWFLLACVAFSAYLWWEGP